MQTRTRKIPELFAKLDIFGRNPQKNKPLKIQFLVMCPSRPMLKTNARRGAFPAGIRRSKRSDGSEAGAVYTPALRAADLVDQGEFEGSVIITCRHQVGDVDVIAEADAEIVVVETCGEDKCIHKHTGFDLISHTYPGSDLECRVGAAVAGEQEFHTCAGIDLEGRPLPHGNHTGDQAETGAGHEVATCMEGIAAVQVVYAIIEE